jgi:hypothetical protein
MDALPPAIRSRTLLQKEKQSTIRALREFKPAPAEMKTAAPAVRARAAGTRDTHRSIR